MIRRVRDRSTFADLARRGRRGAAGVVTVRFLDGPAPPAVAWSVSRALGPAVVRNQVRRRLRHAARELAPGWPGGTYLVQARPGAADVPYATLRGQLDQAVAAATAPVRSS